MYSGLMENSMSWYIQFLVALPILGFVLSLLFPENKERLISGIAVATISIQLIQFIAITVFWIINDFPEINMKEVVIFKSSHFEFFIDFYFDKLSVVYLAVGIFLTLLVAIYCQYYLHKEKGYKRFFNNLLFFFIGYNLIVVSGNFETLFIGWEILGISSFMLIAFYKNRYLPVKNAFKVFSVYRIADVALILAMWAMHHLWHENITFSKLVNYDIVHEHLQSHSVIGIFISLMLLIAAAAKSAQLPFSSWLPRAMEGPTPSSAIFYGSLSVHLGVFLLLRTYHFWEHQIFVRILIGLLGLTTAIIATQIARVQSSAKSQIAYASIAQIGIIFIETAAGLETLALIHFAGNAFLRTYQLLVSPSIVSYLIREQFYNYVERPLTYEDSLPKRIEYSFYLLSVKEWNLDLIMNYILWNPLKNIGRLLDFLSIRNLFYIFVPVYVIGLISLFAVEDISAEWHNILASQFAILGLIMVFKSYTERKSPFLSWMLIVMNHLWIALAISFNEHFSFQEALFYLSGVIGSAVVGLLCLFRLNYTEKHIDLNQFYGHVYEHPKLSLVFLVACLGLTGFPITPTFIGEDLIFSHIHEHQFILAFAVSSSFVVSGISCIRIYALLFLGPHIKTYHETPYRSS